MTIYVISYSSPSKESSPPFAGGARRKTGSVGGSSLGSVGSGPSSSESGSAGVTTIASPVFKSAAAKAIIQEVGGNSGGAGRAVPRSKAKVKKRSFTITGSQRAAVLEAIQNHNSIEVNSRIIE